MIITEPILQLPGSENKCTLTTSSVPTITKIVGDDKDLSYKASKDNQVRVMISDKTSYEARIVVKGLHHTTHMDYIKEELSAQGHTVRDAHNAIGPRSKSSISLFFINLEPAPNNKEAFKMKRLCKSVVTVEPPLKFNDIPQCYRCHGYGHRRRYKLQVRCVKCGKDHATSECQKKREDAAKCDHCGGAHPASYKGCPTYKEAKTVLSPKEPRLAQPKDVRYIHGSSGSVRDQI